MLPFELFSFVLLSAAKEKNSRFKPLSIHNLKIKVELLICYHLRRLPLSGFLQENEI